MLNVKAILLSSFLLSAVLSSPVKAEYTKFVECQACETPSQMATAARKEALLYKWSYISVMNFAKNDIAKFKVMKYRVESCESEGEPDGRGGVQEYCRYSNEYYTHPQNISSLEFQHFNELARAINEAQKYTTAQYSIKVPRTTAETGWELMHASYMQSRLINLMYEKDDGKAFVEKSLIAIEAASKLSGAAAIDFKAPAIRFDFSDGSKVYAKVNFVTIDGEIDFKFLTLYDQHGNKIEVDGKISAGDKFYFVPAKSTKDFETFQKIVNSMGLAIFNNNHTMINVPSGTIIVSNCPSGEVCPSPN